MLYERIAPQNYIRERYEMNNSSNHKFSFGAARGDDPLMRVFAEPEPAFAAEQTLADSQRRLKAIVESARKVLTDHQVAIVVMAPYLVYWVTQHQEQLLGTGAGDVTMIADALEPKLGGPNSELVAEHVVRASTRAQLGIQNRNSIELHASSTKSYKADLDCYFDDPGVLAIIALLTPMSLSSKTGYEEAQLSSIRYHLGVLHPKQPPCYHHQSSGRYARHDSLGTPGSSEHKPHNTEHGARSVPSSVDGRAGLGGSGGGGGGGGGGGSSLGGIDGPKSGLGPGSSSTVGGSGLYGDELATSSSLSAAKGDVQNTAMHDFIPSMMCRELDYFYAMLPETASGSYLHHERELSKAQSIREQEQQAMDPDNVDPHLRMRLSQQLSLSPVLPRRPRDIAEVQAEIERSRLLAKNLTLDGHAPSSKKNGDIRCLECGTDTSPEWRKGPNGPKTLCNRCGLRFAKKLRLQK